MAKKMVQQQINEIRELLQEVCEDECASQLTKSIIFNVLNTMQQDIDISIMANKVLDELERLLENNNLDSHVRTQLWSITSLLETL